MPTVLSPITCFPVGSETLKCHILTNYGSGLNAGASFTHGTHNLVYDLYTGSGNTIRRLKFENRRWVDHNTGDQPVMYDGNGWAASNIITQTAQNPQTVYIKWYTTTGSFTNPYYDANWSPPPTQPSSITIDSSWGAWSGQTPVVTLDELAGGSNTHYVYYASHGDTTNSIKVTQSSPYVWSDADASGTPALVEEATINGVKWVFLADSRANASGYAESDFNNARAKFQVPSFFGGGSGSGSGSGSGGGIQTLSGGTSPEIINVQFTKLSDDSLEVSFDYQNISHFTMFRQWPSGTAPYNVWSNMGGVGTSGSWSGGGSFLQSLSEDTKVWVVGSTDADGNMPVYTHRILDWEIDTTTTPHSMKVKGFFENNGGNGFGFNADVGLHACGPKLSTGCGIKDTQIYDGNLQDMSTDLVWGTLYKVLKPDNTQYGRAYQYGKIPKSGGSSNFW
jgi:hypothetical protein